MEEELFEKLKAILLEIGYTEPELHLELTTSGKVGGHIVSSAFNGKAQMERQNDLWDKLRLRLSPNELTRIVAILTVTPEEIEDD